MRRRVGLAALLCIGACGGTDPANALPAVTLERVDISGSLDLADIEGPAAVNLWATWCAPCRREIPEIEHAHRTLGDDATIIGINIGDDPQQIADFLAGLDTSAVTYPQLADPLAEVADHLSARTLPVTVIVSDGAIVDRVDGPITADQLIDLLAPHWGG